MRLVARFSAIELTKVGANKQTHNMQLKLVNLMDWLSKFV